MEHRKHSLQSNTAENAVERRYAVAGIDVRSSGDGKMTVKGYALRFGSVYDMGWFTEEIDRRALDSADMSDVRILFNHDPNQILGRTQSGTARVGVDNVGMWYEVDLPDSPNGHNARAAIERGDVSQSSWGFSLLRNDVGKSIGDEWEVKGSKKHRRITAVDTVFDASPVVYPANADTSIAKRSLEAVELIEKRDDMEDMGEGVAMPVSITEGEADGTWTVSWMMSHVARATESGNDMAYWLTNYASEYGNIAQGDTKEAKVFEGLAQMCRETKTAVIALIDAHIDALKTLNNAENRGANSVIVHETSAKEGDDTQTNTTDIAELEQFELRRMQLLN